MGSFFTDILSFQHETAVFDVNPHQLRFVYNTYRFTTLEEIKEFEPELVINAATVKYTLDAFRKVLPVLPKDCILSDIASVKTGKTHSEIWRRCNLVITVGHNIYTTSIEIRPPEQDVIRRRSNWHNGYAYYCNGVFWANMSRVRVELV